MELRRYWGVVRKWYWLMALGLILPGTVSYFVSKSAMPIYTASATLQVMVTQNPGIPAYNDLLFSGLLSQTYAQLLVSRPVLEPVIQELGLSQSFEGLSSQVSAKAVRDTQLLQVNVRHTSPQDAAIIANRIADVFIRQTGQSQVGQITATRQNLRQQINSIQDQIDSTSAWIMSLAAANDSVPRDVRAVEQARLQGLLSQYQAVYTQLVKSEQDLTFDEARLAQGVRVVIPAVAPASPVDSKLLQNTLLIALVGLMVAVGVAFLLEYLDDTVKTSEDVERAIALPTFGVVGVVPLAQNGKGSANDNAKKGSSESHRKAKTPQLVAADPKSHFGEAYRMVRTNLQYATLNKPYKTLLVTSAGPEEGKSFTLSNLGVVLAQAGNRVILVDSDIRRPTLHKTFGVAGDVGLVNLLIAPDQTDLVPYLQPTEHQCLHVLTSGHPLPPNPTELLISPQMVRAVAALKQEADIVLFDSPPTLSVADAAILSGLVDGVLLVIDCGRNRGDVIARAKEALSAPGADLLGVVLNRYQIGTDSYYYYYYDYRYRYANPHDGETGRAKVQS